MPPLLPSRTWKTNYTVDEGDLVERFYLPALECGIRYDRSTGYFSASALAVAAHGIEGLIRNDGHMRLIVGCTLDPEEVEAIQKGLALRDAVERRLAAIPLEPPDQAARDALELLSWMVARGILDIKVAIPCNANRQPIPSDGLFHEKAGIIEDGDGNRLAFNGSLNETAAGWRQNWDSFHVFTTWTGTTDHVDEEETSFQRLWANKSKRVVVIDVPEAVRGSVLAFLPKTDRPARLAALDKADTKATVVAEPQPVADAVHPPIDRRRQVWDFISRAPRLSGGDRVGEATAAITPWPHQIRAFQRMYQGWPPKLLIADEVGLGKTISAGLVLRQAWVSGRARRILILAPKAVLRQWQVELREKFNLNWPLYDDQRLTWYPTRLLGSGISKPVSRQDWHKEPCVIVSSHLMRRRDRAKELIEEAEPWDLVILDEAHHARRRSAGAATEGPPNRLLRLMQDLRKRTKGLVLLTATPMQVSPIEVWDLLALLDLPQAWSSAAFVNYFEAALKASPSHEEFDRLAALFRATEAAYGEYQPEDAVRFVAGGSRLRAKKLLRVLRDPASTPRRMLETGDRADALKVLRANTPIAHLISRHTRELLRRYYKAGKLKTPIADRLVEDRFVILTPEERRQYEAVEDYISTTYDNAAAEQRNAVGFVMTTYRRRLASSFYALQRTLEARLKRVVVASDEDLPDDELVDDDFDEDEAAKREREALALEERSEIERLLKDVKALPPDTKARALVQTLAQLRDADYRQVMVFTQYTDTMDFLRSQLAKAGRFTVMCFSGRGGERYAPDGTWQHMSREDTKRRFREGEAEILLCTDAAAEGLNFQFCGALVNYDMPWNPMRVEQRIGRIDRLGQEHHDIRIVNLHYKDTVEADVYQALRERIRLFQAFVGKLQPILARLPRGFAEVTLGKPGDRERARADLVAAVQDGAVAAEAGGFDLDAVLDSELEEPVRPASPYTMADLDRVLGAPDLLPPGVAAKTLQAGEYAYQEPGMDEPVRVTALELAAKSLALHLEGLGWSLLAMEGSEGNARRTNGGDEVQVLLIIGSHGVGWRQVAQCKRVLSSPSAIVASPGRFTETAQSYARTHDVLLVEFELQPAAHAAQPLCEPDRSQGPGRFWVYENWRASDKAVVHLATCGHCKDGQGVHGTSNTTNGQWRGPFDGYGQAEADARSTGRSFRNCGSCWPQSHA